MPGKALHLPAAYGHEVTEVADLYVFPAFILVCVRRNSISFYHLKAQHLELSISGEEHEACTVLVRTHETRRMHGQDELGGT